MKEINLCIPKKKVKKVISPDLKKKLLTGTVILLSLFLLTFIFSLGYYVALKSAASNLLKEEETLKTIVKSKNEAEGLYISFLQKIAFAEKIIQGRQDFASLLSKVETFFPAGITLSTLNFDENGSVVLSLTLADPESADKFLQPIISDPKLSSTLTMNSLSRTKEGQYSLNLELKNLSGK